MSSIGKIFRQTLTIARRDFIATVFTPTFLLFLLAPVIMGAFGAIGGLGAATMADSGESKVRLVAIAQPNQAPGLVAADTRARKIFVRGDAPAPLRIDSPGSDPAAQARALFDAKDIEVVAVMYGPLERPTILHGPRATRSSEYLAQLAEETLQAQRAAGVPLSTATRKVVDRQQLTPRGKGQTAFFATFGLFFLTLMLAGQAVGTMAEERSNKVIEVLAAAVPLESVFLGKLIGMFGVALLFLLFWGTVVVNGAALVPAEIARAFSDAGPAVGPIFPLLFLAYFVMSYMLQGAVFLGVGAQAGTPRELQMLSLPITIFQVAMFGFAAAAAARPDSWIATAAEVFPFSSPLAMAARAANSPELWRHALALAWQVLWVAITVSVGARLFRRGVLQSGSPKLGFKRKREAIDTAVS